MALKRSLLHGLRAIEDRGTVEVTVGGRMVWGEEGEGEGAGLPISGDLPSEMAATPEVIEEGKEGGECEDSGVSELSATSNSDDDNLVGRTMTSEPYDLASSTLNSGTDCMLPTYATAVSNPFRPVLKRCLDSVPTTQQSNSGPPETTTVTVTNPITMATVTMDTHGNKDAMLPSNNPPTHLATENTSETKSDFKTGQDNRLSQVTELTVPLSNELVDGYNTLARCGPASWSSTGWREDGGVCTPRSDSSLSVRSSASSSGKYNNYHERKPSTNKLVTHAL